MREWFCAYSSKGFTCYVSIPMVRTLWRRRSAQRRSIMPVFMSMDTSPASRQRRLSSTLHLVRRFAAPVFLDVMATDRSLYGALDILRRATTTFEPAEFLARDHRPPFTLVTASIGGVPTTLQIQDSGTEGRMALKDGDPRVHRGLSPCGGFSPRCSQHALHSGPSDLEQQPFVLAGRTADCGRSYTGDPSAISICTDKG